MANYLHGFCNAYSITPGGKVFSHKKPKTKLLSQCARNGYLGVHLSVNGKAKMFLVHRLVASVFLGLDVSDINTQVNHKDGNKQNNNVSNLELVTASENTRHYHQNNPSKSSKHMGVSYRANRGTWQAYTFGGKVKYLGSFKTEQEAINAHKTVVK